MRTQPSPLTHANLADVQSQEANPFLAVNINDSKLLLSVEEPLDISHQAGHVHLHLPEISWCRQSLLLIVVPI